MGDHQESDSGLLAIEVDADDDAETAAGDTPSVSRTYQSEESFQAIKTNYTAKHDGGTTYQDLISAVPVLDFRNTPETQAAANGDEVAKVKLSKRDFQLLGYAVGEMYLDKDYEGILHMCGRVREKCEVDAKVAESLERWERRCRGRIG